MLVREKVESCVKMLYLYKKKYGTWLSIPELVSYAVQAHGVSRKTAEDYVKEAGRLGYINTPGTKAELTSEGYKLLGVGRDNNE